MNYTREEADDKLLPAVNLTIRDLKKNSSLDTNFRALCIDQLKVFLSTHRSICSLLAKEDEDPVLGVDALSLAREQVEKVFAVALLCEDPTRWARTYLEDAWRRMFERYLLEKEERQDLAGFQGFVQQAYAKVEGVRNGLGIAEDVRDLIEYKFFNPQDPKGGPPRHLVGVKKLEKFPMPSGVLQQIAGPKKEFLRRWYREYQFFCDFTHCGMGKLEPVHLYDPGSRFSREEKEVYYAKEIQYAAVVSYITMASTCTELVELLGISDFDRVVELTDLWAFLRARFFLAKAMWGLRAQHLLPPLLGS